jgi:hypothetical protein
MDEHIIESVPDTPPEEITCTTCGTIGLAAISEAPWPHWRKLSCASCGAFARWLSKYTPAEREARRQQFREATMATKPPSAAQLDWLKALGDTGPPPLTMAEASARIDALVRKGGE